MNCETFENIVNDLARASVMEAGTRENGLAHVETCARCAARLASERQLSAALREAAADMSAAEAPPRVEAALLTAFRERAAAVRFTPAAARANVGVWHKRRWAIRTAAAAAMILILFALIALRLQRPTTSEQVGDVPSQQLAPQDEPGSGPKGGRYQPDDTLINHEQEIVRQPQSPRRTGGQPRAIAMPGERIGKTESLPVIYAATIYGDAEIATDFLPLTPNGNPAPMNSGQVVRVRMPRAALASFGLPVNMERVGERIQADVLLAEDGSARAIRFIR